MWRFVNRLLCDVKYVYTHHNNWSLQWEALIIYRLRGLVVKTSAHGARSPRFYPGLTHVGLCRALSPGWYPIAHLPGTMGKWYLMNIYNVLAIFYKLRNFCTDTRGNVYSRITHRQIKYTLIRQLTRSSLIRVYFTCKRRLRRPRYCKKVVH